MVFKNISIVKLKSTHLRIDIPPGTVPRIATTQDGSVITVAVHFDCISSLNRPLKEEIVDVDVNAEPADADNAHIAKMRRKDDKKAALAERLVEASDSGDAAEEEGQTEEEDTGSVDSDDDDDDVRVKGKMARKSPNAEQLAFAHRLVAAIDKPAELTQIFASR